MTFKSDCNSCNCTNFFHSGVTLVCTTFKSEMEQLTSKTKCVCTYAAPFWASRYLEQCALEWGVFGVLLVCACASRDLSPVRLLLFRLQLFRVLQFRLLSFRSLNIFTSIGESSITNNAYSRLCLERSPTVMLQEWNWSSITFLCHSSIGSRSGCVLPVLSTSDSRVGS